MRQLLVALGLALMSAINPAIAQSEGKNLMTPEQSAVLNAVQKMTSAFHDGEIESVMDSYEDGATVVFEPGMPISDHAVLREMFQGAFTINPHFDYGGHEVFVTGDIAVHFAPWTMTGKTSDGQAISQSGLSVAVLRKQPDGRWLMVFDNPHGQNLLTNMQ